MAMESLLPLFQEGGAPEQDPVLSQLMDPSAQDDLFSDLLGDDFLSSLLEPSIPPPTEHSPSHASPDPQALELDPSVFTVHHSPVTNDGCISDQTGSPASLTSEYLEETVPSSLTDATYFFGLNGYIMEPTVSTTARSPSSSTSSDVRIDVDLVPRDDSSPAPLHRSGAKRKELKAATLVLTEEEQRMLAEEGIVLPTDMPLTKAEQKHLKRVRRKVKNKISAQESRRRKKDYVDGLEHRVEKSTRINHQLQNKVHSLETQNKSLLSQLRKLQALVADHYPSRLQAGGLVMVLTLSFSLFFVPHLRHSSPPGTSYHTVSVQSRSLLFTETDEFGNLVDPESGKVISEVGGLSPVLPPPWTYQTPAFDLLPHTDNLTRNFRINDYS